MIEKARYESLELIIFRSLRQRMSLTAKEESYYVNLEKGYQGEKEFDKQFVPLPFSKLVLNDLLLECNHTIFQIDSLFMTSNTIYLFEIKNYEGDFLIEADRWYSNKKVEIKNPLLQLQRNESLLRRLLQDLRCSYSIEPYLIFINPEFQLYQSPLNSSIVFPAQINRFMAKLNKNTSTIKEPHKQLSKQLQSMHLDDHPYTRLPSYAYENLKKGIPCPHCQTFYKTYNKVRLLCHVCHNHESIETAVLRSAEEFKKLFPEKKITTNAITDWCDIIKSKKTISRILSKNFKHIGHGKTSYYINND
ncbi:nuclease-related domain-containing protein [Halalkalibacter okhensis]|uniref:NERD domain-containing protein n=1 Tax=Halalkalibacter okhensis TaxID=333138 RepID=A0A0B0IGV7_9BACI|nr:nuclease-related domain-containing protein [Halalkalibacter okhensis]KHF40122.1 hypothetical protein LQ50_11455 [Halalkalibacter okhensis]